MLTHAIRYRLIFGAKTIRCLATGGHRWVERYENVAPDVVSYANRGWEECRCGRVRNEWGYV